ncbi:MULTISPECIES: response regulator transcription factor [unclassified Brevundimonas]|jgi:DNA-binding response OmpR family regulator|uniref:response regulator transcription factor n=1 Tax=unclassified Brevundimonas TaxID=2622653 RepID=UPI0025BC65DD|nr:MULTISPECIES: response regulator transcription factor [unclassified Brevundimonas]
MRVLIVEDEPWLAETLRSALVRERMIVDLADHLAAAHEAIAMASFDLALLDRTLPDGDGLSLIEALRAKTPGIPVIILSARGDISDRILGLDEGADDYLMKPFAIDEMLARIRAVRRRPADVVDEEVHAGKLVFSVTNDEASINGVLLKLPRRELRVLAALLQRRGRTVLRESLEQAVFGFDDAVQSNTLDSHISRLRRRLSDAGALIEIHPIRGVGYLLREAP